MTSPTLSPTEWTVMNICWRLGPATAREVHRQSLADRARDYRTVKTLLDRIVEKGYLRVEKRDGTNVYVPIAARRRTVATALEDFVDRVLDRKLAPLYLHLAERDDLSEEEAAFFRKQLERMEADDGESQEENGP
jgi:predicted transcriptional regulator